MTQYPSPIFSTVHETDLQESSEWLAALNSVISESGIDRAQYVVHLLINQLRDSGVNQPIGCVSPPINTKLEDFTSKVDKSKASLQAGAIIRYNAIMMVLRAGKKAPELGGHLATFASIADLWQVGFDYFFRGDNDTFSGDMVYFQGHASPGIYARAFMEGRLSETQLDNFRQEVAGHGLSSYPHPYLMPDFWQFPTVSMGLGPITAIYQAHVLNYMEQRGLIESNPNRHIWVFAGDGEMDEPESVGALSLAAREGLSRLTMVVNCNLQRLDGPVRSNGHIVAELESVFRGAGWRVIKLMFNSAWDALFALDKNKKLQQRLASMVDGQMQSLITSGVNNLRETLFTGDDDLIALGNQFTDEQLSALHLGGHDHDKIYAAYDAAKRECNQPTVILAQTLKGYALGKKSEAVNTTHQQKKLTVDDLCEFVKRFDLDISRERIEQYDWIRPEQAPEAVNWLKSKEKS